MLHLRTLIFEVDGAVLVLVELDEAAVGEKSRSSWLMVVHSK